MPRSAGMKAGYEAELNDKKGKLELGKETLEQLYMFPSTDVQIKESPELTLKYEQALKNAEMACNALGSTVKTIKLAVETLNHLVCVCSLFLVNMSDTCFKRLKLYIYIYMKLVGICVVMLPIQVPITTHWGTSQTKGICEGEIEGEVGEAPGNYWCLMRCSFWFPTCGP